jgi:hypothetical protein
MRDRVKERNMDMRMGIMRMRMIKEKEREIRKLSTIRREGREM